MATATATKSRPAVEPEKIEEILDNLPAPSQPSAPPVPVESTIFAIIERAARDPGVDIDKLERLIAMQERVQSKQAELEFDNAMAAAQAEMQPVRVDSNNPQTRSKYASYAALDNAIRPIYARHGFSLSFDTSDGASDGDVRIVCKVAHRGGHRERPRIDMPADGKGAKGGDVMTRTHAMGSAVSYGKRYLLGMIFNLATTKDDDGNAAGGYKPAPGSAGGGTDFRPERRGNGVPSNFVEAARQDGTLDETRQKGTMPGAKAKPTPAERAKVWTDTAIETLNLSGQTRPTLDKWWKDNDGVKDDGTLRPIAWLRENDMAQMSRLETAFENARDAASARVPA